MRKQREQHKPDPRVVGGRYLSGYWGEEYTVLERQAQTRGLIWFCVQWHGRDARQTTHCTAWDWKRDRIVEVPA